MEKNIFAVLWGKIFPPAGKSKASGVQEASTENKVVSTATQSAESTIESNTADQLYAKISKGANYVYVFEVGERSTSPKGMGCESHSRTSSDAGYVKLSNGDPDATPGGITGGYSIRLPDEIEAAASGHSITVSIIARASGNVQSRFAVAYSTNGSGNSGWRWFDAGAGWSIYETEYNAPVMNKKNGNFIGLLVEGEGHPGTEFCYLAIRIN